MLSLASKDGDLLLTLLTLSNIACNLRSADDFALQIFGVRNGQRDLYEAAVLSLANSIITLSVVAAPYTFKNR